MGKRKEWKNIDKRLTKLESASEVIIVTTEPQDSLDLEMRKMAEHHLKAFGLSRINSDSELKAEAQRIQLSKHESKIQRLENDVWGLQINKQNKPGSYYASKEKDIWDFYSLALSGLWKVFITGTSLFVFVKFVLGA